MPQYLTHPREYIEGRGFDVRSFSDTVGLLAPKIKGKKKDKLAADLEKNMGAAYFARSKKRWEKGFVAVPKRFLDKDVTWGEYAAVAHEVGHGEMFKRVPSPLVGLTGFAASGGLAGLGSLVAMTAIGQDKGVINASIKIAMGITAAGTTAMLASESWANLTSARELSREKAPLEAYQMPVGSELSYIGKGMLDIGMVGGFGAIAKRNVRLGIISGATVAAGYGINKLGRNMFGKLVGHHPGWSNKNVEEAIDSDFTAGESWTGIKNSLAVFARNRKRGIAATVLAGTLVVSPTSKVLAQDLTKEAMKSTTKVSQALWKQEQAGVVQKYLMGTGAQETWLGKYFDKFKEGGGKVLRQIHKGKPQGVARSIYQLEKPTVEDMVKLYVPKYKKELLETTGYSYDAVKKMMSEGTLMTALEQPKNIDLSSFLAAMKMKYTERVGYTIPKEFSVDDAAKWWGKYYKTGGTQKQLEQFKANYKAHVVPSMDATAGLVNISMHENKTMHQIQDVTTKTKHLFKIR